MIQHETLKVKQFFEQNNRFKTLHCQNSNDYWKLINSNYFISHPDNYKQVQINCNSLTQAMAFDIDYDDPLAFKDYGLPQPSIITVNADNGKSHIVYYLKAPVSVGKAKDYMLDLYDGIATTLNADSNYSNRTTKNYLNQKEFKTYGSLQSYELGDFSDFTKNHIKPLQDAKKLVKTHFSRNCELFDTLRHYAYKIYKDYETLESFNKHLHDKAIITNASIFGQPLPDSEVKDIAKSISKWTFENYAPKNWNWDGYTKKPAEEVSVGRSKVKTIEHKAKLQTRCANILERRKKDARNEKDRARYAQKNTNF